MPVAKFCFVFKSTSQKQLCKLIRGEHSTLNPEPQTQDAGLVVQGNTTRASVQQIRFAFDPAYVSGAWDLLANSAGHPDLESYFEIGTCLGQLGFLVPAFHVFFIQTPNKPDEEDHACSICQAMVQDLLVLPFLFPGLLTNNSSSPNVAASAPRLKKPNSMVS